MLPPAPDVASPDLKTTEPLLPLLLEPVANDKAPLTPDVPESDVLILNAPLVLPPPLEIETEPPVSALPPPLMTTRPPSPVFPAPTTTLILPPAPLVASPLRSTSEPEDPFVDVPVFSDRPPLIPLVPASLVTRLNAPLELAPPADAHTSYTGI